MSLEWDWNSASLIASTYPTSFTPLDGRSGGRRGGCQDVQRSAADCKVQTAPRSPVKNRRSAMRYSLQFCCMVKKVARSFWHIGVTLSQMISQDSIQRFVEVGMAIFCSPNITDGARLSGPAKFPHVLCGFGSSGSCLPGVDVDGHPLFSRCRNSLAL